MMKAPGQCSTVIVAFGSMGPQCCTVRATPGIAQSLFAKVSMKNSSAVKFELLRVIVFVSCFYLFISSKVNDSKQQ